MNPQNCVWKNHYRMFMRTILQEREQFSATISFGTQIYSYASSYKISAWNLTKVRCKSEVIDEARTKGAKVHFASLMDICHLKNAELEAKHQEFKGRVVLRGDIVKDDS